MLRSNLRLLLGNLQIVAMKRQVMAPFRHAD
jgi:hypothetical protein